MSLLDLASLVLSPTATKEGKVYSAIPDTGDGDMTFSRGTEATRVNSAGLIEKARTNLLLQSNTFDTTWTQTNVSVTGGQTGYDGSSDAWLVDISASFAQVEQNISTSGVITYSVYAKAGTLGFVRLRLDASTNAYADFDLSSGTAGTTSGIITTSSTSLADGWYRLSLVTNASSATKARIYPIQADNDLTATSGNILIQDAQLEQGLVSTDVITTTTSSVTVGITDDLPRVDYSGGGCPSLLLEGSRTNLITQSEYLDAWTKSGCTIANNESTSPEGVDNASKFIASSGLSVKIAYQIISSTNSVAHTVSAFYKSDEYNYAFLRVGGQSPSPYVIYNLSNQSIVSTANATSTKIEDYGSGWYRVSVTYTANNTTNAVNVSFLPTSGYSLDSVNQPSYNGDGSSGGYVYGVQLESSASYVSSYLPSYGTSTSRSADSCSLTGASNLIDSTEGTIYLQSNSADSDVGTYSYFMTLSDGTSNNRLEIRQSGSEVQFLWRVGGTYQNNIITSGIDITQSFKLALKYSSDAIKMFFNGSLVNTLSSPTLYSANTLNRFGFDDGSGGDKFQGESKELVLFPTALSDDQCIALTK